LLVYSLSTASGIRLAFNFSGILQVVPFFKPIITKFDSIHSNTLSMQPMQPMQPTQTMQTVEEEEEYDFENDDDSFYDFIEFGIASNGGRLSIQRR